jgi:haloacid dehalogenase-like hydrolase
VITSVQVKTERTLFPSRSDNNHSGPLSEAQFYALYDWCINPVLSLGDLLKRLGEELERWGRVNVRWQREECQINLYLFSSAVACTVDDYLAIPSRNITGIAKNHSFLKLPAAAAQLAVNAAHTLPRFLSDRCGSAWREEWGRFLDRVCDIVVQEQEVNHIQMNGLQAMFRKIAKAKLPQKLLLRRMILPEGFRCQDLAHQDLLAMVRKTISRQKQECRFGIIGPRTFAAYFAPLVSAYVKSLNWPTPTVMTLRPKWGISEREKKKLRQLVSQSDHVLIVDDYPNTGETVKKLVRMVTAFGARPERISFLAPMHHAEKPCSFSDGRDETGHVDRDTLLPDELHKERFLNSPAAEALLREYFTGLGFDEVAVRESSAVDEVNDRLRQHYGDGFHVRMKRVYDVAFRNGDARSVKRVFAKSVGWGWLGYHAYLSGTRLSAFVPKVIGLRNGLLFTEWIEESPRARENRTDRALLSRLSSYVARRTESLRLTEDPWFASPGYRWTGWETVVDVIRSAYGPIVDRLAMPLVQRRLGTYASPSPTLVDGHMRRDEWIETDGGIRKVDFEHHNFGGPELDMVDPAYDLASAIYEFRLSAAEEQELIHLYAQAAGDRQVFERVPVHKLLYGMTALQEAAYWVTRAQSPAKKDGWNERYLEARNFLIDHLHRFCARRISRQNRTNLAGRPFFLDLDGVFDTEALGFPHTTYSGLLALRLLWLHDFQVILNTGRSAEQVANYCTTYGFAGGVAEYGSVYVDAVRRCEVPLIDAETAGRLTRCREALRAMPGVFVDPAYRYSIRAYRYRGSRTESLDTAEVKLLLERLGAGNLDFINQGNTFIVQMGVSKGSGFAAAKKITGYQDTKVFAIGDTVQDGEMLEAADYAYAPSSCSEELYDLATRGKCRIMAEPCQRGLLAAVREIIRDISPARVKGRLAPERPDDATHLLWFLLYVAELPRFAQLARTIQWSFSGSVPPNPERER